MNWLFPPEGCDGSPVNAAMASSCRTSFEVQANAMVSIIIFVFNDECWETWYFATEESRDQTMQDIKARLSGGQS